jgi:MoaA/NifB/PqqE/SkfB family radical SAM enzyme
MGRSMLRLRAYQRVYRSCLHYRCRLIVGSLKFSPYIHPHIPPLHIPQVHDPRSGSLPSLTSGGLCEHQRETNDSIRSTKWSVAQGRLEIPMTVNGYRLTRQVSPYIQQTLIKWLRFTDRCRHLDLLKWTFCTACEDLSVCDGSIVDRISRSSCRP